MGGGRTKQKEILYLKNKKCKKGWWFCSHGRGIFWNFPLLPKKSMKYIKGI
jgi:hypothetical protein